MWPPPPQLCSSWVVILQSCSSDSSMMESFHVTSSDHTRLLLSPSHILCASLFLSLTFFIFLCLFLLWPQRTFSHPPQTQSCPTECHIEITQELAVNYGWNVTGYRFLYAVGDGEGTLPIFRIFLALGKYCPLILTNILALSRSLMLFFPLVVYSVLQIVVLYNVTLMLTQIKEKKMLFYFWIIIPLQYFPNTIKQHMITG